MKKNGKNEKEKPGNSADKKKPQKNSSSSKKDRDDRSQSREESRRSSQKLSRRDSRQSRKSNGYEADDGAKSQRSGSQKSEKIRKFKEELDQKFKIPEQELHKEGEDQLQYLERRIGSLENMIEEMKLVMVEEAKTRITLAQDFEEKEKKVQKYLEREEMELGKKVQKELKKYLEASAQEYNQLKKEKDEIFNRFQEHVYLASELDSVVIQMSTESRADKEEVKMLNELVSGLKTKMKDTEQILTIREGENLEQSDRIRKLSKEVDDLRGVLYKLNDVRTVLNRVLDPYSNKWVFF